MFGNQKKQLNFEIKKEKLGNQTKQRIMEVSVINVVILIFVLMQVVYVGVKSWIYMDLKNGTILICNVQTLILRKPMRKTLSYD